MIRLPCGSPAASFVRAAAVGSPPLAWRSIQWRMSSARQTVTRSDNLSGCGKLRAWMRRQSVDLEIGTSASTCGWRTKPVWGSVVVGAGAPRAAGMAAMELAKGMIEPRHGVGRQSWAANGHDLLFRGGAWSDRREPIGNDGLDDTSRAFPGHAACSCACSWRFSARRLWRAMSNAADVPGMTMPNSFGRRRQVSTATPPGFGRKFRVACGECGDLEPVNTVFILLRRRKVSAPFATDFAGACRRLRVATSSSGSLPGRRGHTGMDLHRIVGRVAGLCRKLRFGFGRRLRRCLDR